MEGLEESVVSTTRRPSIASVRPIRAVSLEERLPLPSLVPALLPRAPSCSRCIKTRSPACEYSREETVKTCRGSAPLESMDVSLCGTLLAVLEE